MRRVRAGKLVGLIKLVYYPGQCKRTDHAKKKVCITGIFGSVKTFTERDLK